MTAASTLRAQALLTPAALAARYQFPSIDANSPGDEPLAQGGVLSPECLLAAYYQGFFPWFNAGDPIYWWHPDPRAVFAVDKYVAHHGVRKKYQQCLRYSRWQIRFDTAFRAVIQACAEVPRSLRATAEVNSGTLTAHHTAGAVTPSSQTWISPEFIEAYTALHQAGYAHSVEIWSREPTPRLVGGLYGVAIGRMFFGESMFHLETDASKVAHCALMALLKTQGVQWCDCQQDHPHNRSLGAITLPRATFLQQLQIARDQELLTPWQASYL